jgi:hypothetical protein
VVEDDESSAGRTLINGGNVRGHGDPPKRFASILYPKPFEKEDAGFQAGKAFVKHLPPERAGGVLVV